MKLSNFIYASIAILTLSACSEADTPMQPTENLSSASIRTEKEAMEIAEGLPAIFGNDESRATKACSEVIRINNDARSSEQSTIYAVNYEDGEGFALIAGVKSVDPVLAYVEKGSYSDDIDNPGFLLFMEKAVDYLESQPMNTIGEIPADRPITTTVTIPSRILVDWGQEYPEGIYCSNQLAGCAQTAEAMILTYTRPISSIQLYYPDRDIECQELDWSKIIQHKTSATHFEKRLHIQKCNAEAGVHAAIGRLCRELGRRNHATYKPDVTSTPNTEVYDAYKTLAPGKISSYEKFETGGALYNSLNQKECVALVFGTITVHEPDSTLDVDHYWVCDGGKCATTTSKMPLIDGTIETKITKRYYYHYNWGWCGEGNGYFIDGVFDVTLDNSRNGGFFGDIGQVDNSIKYYLISK